MFFDSTATGSEALDTRFANFVRLASQTAGQAASAQWNALLPIIRRAVQTGLGPTAVVRWVQHELARDPGFEPTERLAWDLTERLLRQLSGTPQSLVDTVRM